MATVGVNGAAAATLNERFIKCAGCKVNIPKEDMLALGKCTVCGRVYEAPASVPTVPFATETASSSAGSKATAEKPKRKRWATLTSKRGRTYYHNTETGEDTWEKPADFDADAVDNDGFVPFKNDTIKNAVLREQAKMDATKMGLPAEVIESLQHQQRQQEGNPVDSLLARPAQSAASTTSQHEPAARRQPGYNNNASIREEEQGEYDDEDGDDGGDGNNTTHSHATHAPSPAKQSSCVVM